MSEKKSTSLEKKKDTRTRNYATIVYPESAPNGWQSILSEYCIPAFISPLHDLDLNATGEEKKAHFHVMLCYDGPKSEDQAKAVFEMIGGVGCQVVNSVRGYARYLCHLDNPEKVQYNASDVISIGGLDYYTIISLASDKHAAIKEMEQFCEKYDIFSFWLLCKYASAKREDWKRVLDDNGSFYMREYLQSRYWSKQNGQDEIIDPVTGEILEY